MIAQRVSAGFRPPMNTQPQRGDRTPSSRNLSPLRGWSPYALQPTAHAVGYPLSVLRTWKRHFDARWGCQPWCVPKRLNAVGVGIA
jgi:hypothetical protein